MGVYLYVLKIYKYLQSQPARSPALFNMNTDRIWGIHNIWERQNMLMNGNTKTLEREAAGSAVPLRSPLRGFLQGFAVSLSTRFQRRPLWQPYLRQPPAAQPGRLWRHADCDAGRGYAPGMLETSPKLTCF